MGRGPHPSPTPTQQLTSITSPVHPTFISSISISCEEDQPLLSVHVTDSLEQEPRLPLLKNVTFYKMHLADWI